MYELASMGDLPLPQASPPAGHKRERDTDSPEATSPSTPSSSGHTGSPSVEEPRNIAGSRRVSHSQHHHQHSVQPYSPVTPAPSNGGFTPISLPMTGADFALPVHSDELGRLPLYPTATGTLDPAMASGSTGWFSDFGTLPLPAGGPQTAAPPGQLAPPDVPMQVNGQPAEMDSVFSSIVYDQVLSNLSASLAPAATAPMQYPAAVDPQRQPLPTENFEQMMFELGGDAATVMYPDNGTLSMWSNAPAGFE